MILLTRPTPHEILQGVQQAVAAQIIPELQTDDARAQLANALGLLRYLATNFEDAADSLCHEISELSDALTSVLTPLREAGHADLAARLQTTVDHETPDLRIPTLLARTDELQESLLEALLLLEHETESVATTLTGPRNTLRAALVTLNQRQSS